MKGETFEKLEHAIIEGNVPETVLYLLTLAFEAKASDIHIEPGSHTVRSRFRVDGELREVIEYPRSVHPAVLSRIKILANLKIDEQRKPQDGRIQMTTETKKRLELRVSTLPTVNGEKVVMRLQDKNKTIPTLENLGLSGNNYRAMIHTIKNPNGITLVTGPTGSGKTTTLYSALSILNRPEVNIMTIEDPVEYEMEGLSQSQVHQDIGYDFASGLRTALRQDPDIIMVGEIRDQETIEIAIKAALTGHMVLSTIHTNSAIATITRLLDMGVKPFKITAALKTIEAQRLVKKICQDCKEPYDPDPALMKDLVKELSRLHPDEEFDKEILKAPILYKGKGCEKCGGTGMIGRVAIYEVMLIDREIQRMIIEGSREEEIEEVAVKNGMTTLVQDGYIKALKGLVPISEVFKVTGEI